MLVVEVTSVAVLVIVVFAVSVKKLVNVDKVVVAVCADTPLMDRSDMEANSKIALSHRFGFI